MSESFRDRPRIWYVSGEDVHTRIPILKKIRDQGFEVGALGSKGEDKFKASGIPFWHYPLVRGMSPSGTLRANAKLLSLMREFRPDIVHSFNTKPAIFTSILAEKAQVPIRIRTITGMGYVFSSSSPLAMMLRPIYIGLHRRSAKASSMTIFQNPDDQSYFLKNSMSLAGRDALVMGSGIDVEDFLRKASSEESLRDFRREIGFEPGTQFVSMIARLVRHKGVREYLEAARIVTRESPKIRFLLVGPIEGEGWQAIPKRWIEEFRDSVTYLGRRSDVRTILAATDIFALPSYYREGVPRALLEAGLAGLPIITTDMPGCKEIVREGWNGRLVPTRDAKALARAVLDLCSLPQEVRLDFGARSKTHIEQNFSLDGVANSYLEIYRRCLNSDRAV